MKKYRIREEQFEDGRSQFIPQFEDGDRFYDFYDLSGKNVTFKRFNTFDEAMSEIDKDKLKWMKPIEIKIHDVI